LKHNYVKTNECRPILSAAKYSSITVVSGNINHLYIFDGVSSWDVFVQTSVRSLKSTNLLFSRCHIFVSFRNNVGINCTLRQHTVLDSWRYQ